MQLEPGSSLGSYEIVSPLGKGGMGEVYRARDSRLGREVAIKVLPAAFAEDDERLARFEREAKSLATFNHPNIATIHGFESEGEISFLVMELVDGEDLSERIARGPIPMDEAISLFLQIAEGLEAAHEKGIVHRDLKPANIKVNADGRVKILDFGLAKALERPAADKADLSQSPTMTAVATMGGEIIGTAAYMSPEQASGKAVDRRTDIWSFGVCLYEALTGSRAFEGDHTASTLAAVLRDEVNLSRLSEATPPSLSRLVRRCLWRDPRGRLHDAADARLELSEAQEELRVGLPLTGRTESNRGRLPVRAWIAVGALSLALGFTGWQALSGRSVLAPQEGPASMVVGPLAYRPPPGFAPELALCPRSGHLARRFGDRVSSRDWIGSELHLLSPAGGA